MRVTRSDAQQARECTIHLVTKHALRQYPEEVDEAGKHDEDSRKGRPNFDQIVGIQIRKHAHKANHAKAFDQNDPVESRIQCPRLGVTNPYCDQRSNVDPHLRQ